MPTFEPRMSLCCLHATEIKAFNSKGDPVNRNDYEKKDVKTKIVCTHCGKPCDFVPNFALDTTNLELLLRRYKDGDYTFLEAFDAVQEIAKHSLVNLLDKVGQIKYP